MGSKSNSWSDGVPQPTATTSELWGAPMSKTSRGPPPGLGSQKSGGGGGNGAGVGGSNAIPGSGTNGWIGSSLTGRVSGGAGGVGGGGNVNAGGGGGGANWPGVNNSGWNSTWLLLKNLTAQVRHQQFDLKRYD